VTLTLSLSQREREGVREKGTRGSNDWNDSNGLNDLNKGALSISPGFG
jgi:hypothetical protein